MTKDCGLSCLSFLYISPTFNILSRATSLRAPSFRWRGYSSGGPTSVDLPRCKRSLQSRIIIYTTISHNTILGRRLGWAATISLSDRSYSSQSIVTFKIAPIAKGVLQSADWGRLSVRLVIS